MATSHPRKAYTKVAAEVDTAQRRILEGSALTCIGGISRWCGRARHIILPRMQSSQNDVIDSSSALAPSFDARDFSHELVPLGLATRLIGARVYAGGSGCTPERLIGIAHLIAALAPLYTHSADGASVRRLVEEELNSGNFRKGGAELHFIDGRESIHNLAVSHRSVAEVQRLLNSAVNGEDRQSSSPLL